MNDDFDQSISKIEAIVKGLETGQLGLEESLEAFEKGIGLIKNCQARLSEVEKKIVLLTKGPGGSPLESDFDSSKENFES